LAESAGVARRLSWDEVRGLRMARHRLLAPAPGGEMVRVAGDVCGIHAQIMAAAEVSLGMRLVGVDRRDLRRELWERRGLVKVPALRGTIHLLPAGEASRWLAALRPLHLGAAIRSAGQWRVAAERVPVLMEGIGAALDGRRLTRQELGDELGRTLGRWAIADGYAGFGRPSPVWTVAVAAAAAAGKLCFGPNQGARVTFVRADQWVDGWRAHDPDEALAWVFRGYLAAYGPSTPDDFAAWLALDPTRARALARAAGPDVEEVEVEGTPALLLAGAEPPAEVPPTARLMPRFDCFLVGSRPRDQLIPGGAVRDRLTAALPRWGVLGSAAQFPLLLVDGRVAGVWEHRRAGRRLAIRVDAHVALTARHRDLLEADARRLGEILEAAPDLSFGPVEARTHL
jgi:hypothetical protein